MTRGQRTTSTARRLVSVAFASATLLGCALDAYGQTADALRRATLATDRQLRSIGPAVDADGTGLPVHPLRSLVSTDYADLAFLRPLLRGKRIVQIGESGHGMAESHRLKARLVRFLHEELGYRVIAFESDLYQCRDADRRADEAPGRTTLLRCLLGVWHTEEVLPLFDHLRRSRSTARPLRLAGFDIQPIGSNKEHRPDFLRRVVAAADPAYADRVFTLDSAFLEVYARDGSERRAHFRSHRAELLRRYDGLAAFLARNPFGPADSLATDALVARQVARSLAAYIRQQTAPDMLAYAETRDSAMAANIRFLTEELFPDEKIVVWAHNYHVRYANADIPAQEDLFPGVPAQSMGAWLRDLYGDAVYTIGLYAFAGEAVNNGREPYEIPAPPPGSLEQRIAAAGWPIAFLDLSEAMRSGAGAWVDSSVTARFNGRTEQSLVPTEQYDALILLGTVTPPVFLY